MQSKSLIQSLGLLLMGALIIFIVINIGLYFMYYKQASNPVADKYTVVSLRKVYPGKSDQEIYKLLMENWTRSYLYEPFTQFKERPNRGDYVNVDENGFRFSADQASWPPDPKKVNVFVFGGSTTFGYGVADLETVPSRLQEELREKFVTPVSVYNFGRGYYYSTQERVLFEKLLLSGYVPNVAIFIDGLNDFYQDIDEPLFTSRLRDIMEDAVPITPFARVKKTMAELRLRAADLPIFRAANDAARSLSCLIEKCNLEEGQSVPPKTSADLKFSDPKIIGRTIERYLSNKKIIEAVSAIYHIKPIFVWQPVPTYKYNQQSHLFAGSDYGQHKY